MLHAHAVRFRHGGIRCFLCALKTVRLARILVVIPFDLILTRELSRFGRSDEDAPYNLFIQRFESIETPERAERITQSNCAAFRRRFVCALVSGGTPHRQLGPSEP
jgi:hypothetical protein